VIFENFEEFNIDCQKVRFNTSVLKFHAKKKINFENGIHLKKMIGFLDINSRTQIAIQNIKGFNVNSNRTLLRQSDFTNFYVYLNDINFDFYLNSSLVRQNICNSKYFEQKVFSYFGEVKYLFFNDDIFYRKDVCPFVFQNTQLEELGLFKITNSLIFKNQLEFLELNETDAYDLNLKQLSSLSLGIYNEDVSLKVVNRFIFKNIFFLGILGSINRIEENLFESFKKIEDITISLDNLKSIYHNGVKWMKHLNGDLNVTIENETDFNLHYKRTIIVELNENESPFKHEYEYPNEDLCLFKEFPHHQLVYPLIINKAKQPCSCTVLWLTKYFKKIYNSSDYLKYFYAKNKETLTMSQCQLEANTQCDFEEKFRNCENIITTHQGTHNGVYHDFLIFEWLKYVINVYFQTIFSILGFVFNLLIMIVLMNKKRKKDFSNTMYKHIYSNAAFNLIFCLIKSLSLINICIFPRTSFCSSIYKYESSQYFKIIVGNFFGNAFKLCCNISYILFALSRFSVSTSSHTGIFQLVNDMNVKKSYAVIVCISLCFSSFKLLEYKPNEIFAYFDKNFPYNVFDIKYCQTSSQEISSFFAFKCSLFPILNLINNIFNNILFVIICVLIDIFLTRFTNMTLERKLTMLVDERNKNEAIGQRNKITKMILINGTIYSLAHIPVFVITILLIVFKKNLADFCFYYISFTELMEIPESFSLISISLQFFIFKHFDQNFKLSFLEIYRKIFSL
jgi:hypothetical protein